MANDDFDDSEEEPWPETQIPTQELDRAPFERSSFLFRHNLMPRAPDLHEFQPLPSQIPFLLDVFSENVNVFARVVHIPSISRMVRDVRGVGIARLSPSNEALLFAIYYAAIISMEEDDVSILILKIRIFQMGRRERVLMPTMGRLWSISTRPKPS